MCVGDVYISSAYIYIYGGKGDGKSPKIFVKLEISSCELLIKQVWWFAIQNAFSTISPSATSTYRTLKGTLIRKFIFSQTQLQILYFSTQVSKLWMTENQFSGFVIYYVNRLRLKVYCPYAMKNTSERSSFSLETDRTDKKWIERAPYASSRWRI